MGRKSINDRIKRAYTRERRVEIATEWAQDWIGENNSQFKSAEMYVRENQMGSALQALHELYQANMARLYALQKIFENIAEDIDNVPKNDIL